MKKSRRIKDDDLMRTFHEKNCFLCDRQATPSHVKTRGSGGPDTEWNITPLCFIHHTEWGQVGWSRFCSKYSDYWELLESMGWEINGMKLWHPKLRRSGDS